MANVAADVPAGGRASTAARRHRGRPLVVALLSVALLALLAGGTLALAGSGVAAVALPGLFGRTSPTPALAPMPGEETRLSEAFEDDEQDLGEGGRHGAPPGRATNSAASNQASNQASGGAAFDGRVRPRGPAGKTSSPKTEASRCRRHQSGSTASAVPAASRTLLCCSEEKMGDG